MHVIHPKMPYGWQCAVCGKQPVTGTHKPHSQTRSKRTVWPNLQPFGNGLRICTRCMKKAIA